MNKLLTLLLAGLLAGALSAGCSNDSAEDRDQAEWPRRPIQISCFAAPGGGTDTVSRTIAAAMGEVLDVRINVINRTGGRGGVAMNYVWSRDHDGHFWGGFSETILPVSVWGGHHTTAKDWTYFLVAGAPGAVTVAGDSPYKTLEELLAAARAKPGAIKAAAAFPGGLWHTKLVALEKAAGVRFNFITYDGSQPSQLAVLSGEVDLCLTSISEQADLITDGRLRALAMVEAEPYEFPGLGQIPSAADAYPAVAELPVWQWLGFALPADTPQDVLAKITEAFKQAMDSPQVNNLAKTQRLNLLGYYGPKADDMVRQMESAWTWMLYEQGIVKKSPAEFGIEKP